MSISKTKFSRAVLAMALFTGAIVVLTQSSASAKASANLDQCANIGPTCDTGNPSQWQNGNLGASQSTYFEGDAVPYRTTLTDLTAGATYALRIGWETTKGGKNALDYLASYDFSETTADPCAGLSCAGPTSLLPIPVDPDVGAKQETGQNFTLYGGTFPASGSSVPNTGNLCATDPCVIAANPAPYTMTGTYSGDSKKFTTVYFTASASTVVLSWGGHIASAIDWGIGNSAATISGSPYHMSLDSFECSNDPNCSAGSQDRSLSNQAVIAPGSITVVKQASVEGSTAFSYTASPAPLSNFSLVDDGTTSNTQVFPGITTFTTYSITEQTLDYWTLGSLSCTTLSPNGGSWDATGSTVTIDLRESEYVTCTFSNTSTYAPELSLSKSASPSVYTAAGDEITYTYTLTNTGNAPLGPDQFTIDDDKINGGVPFDCGPADTTLAVDASVTCTATYTIGSADITAGSVTNTAFGAGGGQTTDTATATVTYADLSIAKSASPTRYLAAGDVITYTYTLTNTGNTVLGPTQFTVTDDKILGGTPFNCGPADKTLALDATVSCTATHTISAADMEVKSVTNTAFGSGGGLTTGTVSKTVRLAALAITKTASPQTFIGVGESVLYTYELTNIGGVALGPTQFTVTDDKIDGGTPFNCGAANTTLAVDATITCTATYLITAQDVESGFVTNNAYGSGDGVTTSEATTTVRFAELSIAKQASPTSYSAVGQTITYTYTLTNTGDSPLGPSQFKVDDDRVNGGVPFNCGAANTTLAVEASVTCTATHVVTSGDISAGSVTNTAFGTGAGLTTSSVAVTVTYAELDIDKVATPSTYDAAGDVITYTYTLTNTGNTVLGPTQFRVTDNKIDGGTPFDCGASNTILNIGAYITCTHDYTTTAANVDAGYVTNAAHGSGAGLTTATVFATVTYRELSIAKSASPTTYAAVGDVITYTYTLTNTGNTVLGPTQFRVTDDRIVDGDPFDCGPAGTTLAIGGSITCTADYTVTGDDITAGSVVNDASATGAGLTTSTVSTTVRFVQLSIAKSASPTRYLAAGSTITYTYTLTNTGNAPLGPTQFTVTDDKIDGGTPFECGAANTTLAVDASVTCTATYTTTAADVENKSVTNTAYGEGAGLTTAPASATVNLAALAIEKTAAPETFIAAGESVLYTYRLTNIGNVALGPTQFMVADDKIDGGTPFECGAANTTLAVDASVTCTATYLITAQDVEDGFVTNSAYGSGDGVTTSQATTTVLWADLSISKQAGPTSFTEAGQVITYTYTLTNTGNAPLGPTQFQVSDDKVNGGTAFNCGAAATTLAVGGTVTCTATYTVTSGDVESGVVTNTAFGTGAGLTTPTVSTSVTYAELSIDKSASPTTYTGAGNSIVYTYTLTNTGNTILGPTQFQVTDNKIDGGTPFDCEASNTVLPIGASITCTNDYVITPTDVDAGYVTNAAFGSGAGLTTPTVFATVTYKQLAIAKSASPTTYGAAGDVITYTYTLTNTGNTVLGPTQFQVTDNKVNGGAAFNCGPAASTLAIGATLTCTATYTVTSADVSAGSITNVATGSGSGVTTPPVLTTVTYKALAIAKVATPTTYDAVGDVITYSYTLTNTGNTVLGPTQFQVTDNKVNGGTTFNCGPAGTTLAIGGTVTCTATYTVVAADLTAGSVVNSATGSGSGVTTPPVSATVTYKQLAITKVATPTTYDAVGDVITYTYTLTNTGNTVLGPTQFQVTDNKVNGGAAFNCGPAGSTLAIGASLTCTATYTVVAADLTAGSVENSATGSGDGLTTPPASTTVGYVPPPTTTTTTVAPTTTTTQAPLQVIFPATTTTQPEEFAVLFPLPKTGSDASDSWWLLALAVLLGSAMVVMGRLMRRRTERS